MFSMSLFTDFTARGRVGILDWYTLSVALFATVLLSAHGATYLRLKTVGPVHERSERLARLLWLITAVLFVVVSVETSVVRPELFQSLPRRPLAWMSVVVIGAAVWALSTGLRGQAERRIALFWWPVAVALALTYFFVIMRIYADKVRPSQGTQGY